MADWINEQLAFYLSAVMPESAEAPGYVIAALIQAALIIQVPAVGALVFI